MGVAHLVAPSPQANGKTNAALWPCSPMPAPTPGGQADEVLQMEIARQNRTVHRTLGKVPLEIWEAQSQRGEGRKRPTPLAALLDLHLSMRCSRRVNHDHTLDFDGHNYEIAPTLRKTVTLVHHPRRQFWILEHPPTDVWPTILGHFTL